LESIRRDLAMIEQDFCGVDPFKSFVFLVEY